MTTVLVAGHVNCDVTLLVDALPDADEESAVRERHRGGGGSAANVAAGLSELDVSAALLGSVGDDEIGRTVRESLAERGVDVDGVRVVPGATSTKYVVVAGEDVAVLGKDGVNEAVEPEEIDAEEVDGVDHVHLTGQRADTAERVAELAVDAGCTVSLDPGRRAGERALEDVVQLADVVFGTDREVEALFGGDPPNAAGAARDVAGTAADAVEPPGDDDPLVVATSGAGGATCYGSEEVAHPGFEVAVTDTTGAGDAFVAGFLAAWLEDGDRERALRTGNACGAIASRQVGARTDLDAGEVSELLDSS